MISLRRPPCPVNSIWSGDTTPSRRGLLPIGLAAIGRDEGSSAGIGNDANVFGPEEQNRRFEASDLDHRSLAERGGVPGRSGPEKQSAPNSRLSGRPQKPPRCRGPWNRLAAEVHLQIHDAQSPLNGIHRIMRDPAEMRVSRGSRPENRRHRLRLGRTPLTDRPHLFGRLELQGHGKLPWL